MHAVNENVINPTLKKVLIWMIVAFALSMPFAFCFASSPHSHEDESYENTLARGRLAVECKKRRQSLEKEERIATIEQLRDSFDELNDVIKELDPDQEFKYPNALKSSTEELEVLFDTISIMHGKVNELAEKELKLHPQEEAQSLSPTQTPSDNEDEKEAAIFPIDPLPVVNEIVEEDVVVVEEIIVPQPVVVPQVQGQRPIPQPSILQQNTKSPGQLRAERNTQGHLDLHKGAYIVRHPKHAGRALRKMHL